MKNSGTVNRTVKKNGHSSSNNVFVPVARTDTFAAFPGGGVGGAAEAGIGPRFDADPAAVASRNGYANHHNGHELGGAGSFVPFRSAAVDGASGAPGKTGRDGRDAGGGGAIFAGGRNEIRPPAAGGVAGIDSNGRTSLENTPGGTTTTFAAVTAAGASPAAATDTAVSEDRASERADGGGGGGGGHGGNGDGRGGDGGGRNHMPDAPFFSPAKGGESATGGDEAGAGGPKSTPLEAVI